MYIIFISLSVYAFAHKFIVNNYFLVLFCDSTLTGYSQIPQNCLNDMNKNKVSSKINGYKTANQLLLQLKCD